jgi:hypothetical protein
MTGHKPLSLRWAAEQANEHRPIISKAVLATLWHAIPDFRSGLYLNAGLLSTASASLILLARRLRGWTSITDAVLPLSILNIGQSECLLIGFALNMMLTAWISYELIVALCGTSQSPGWWPSLLVGGLLVLLSLSGGSGMAMLPPLSLWLAGYVACGWWSGRNPGAWGRAVGLGLLLTTLVAVAFYLKGYERPTHIPATPSVKAACSTTLEYLSLVIRPVGREWGYPRRFGMVVALLVAITLIHLAVVARRSPAERPRAFGLIAILLSQLGVAAAVGVSRAGLGPGSGMISRYISISAPLLSCIYITWLLYGPKPARRAIHVGLLALICAGIPANARSALGMGEGRRYGYIEVERSLRAGLPAPLLMEQVRSRLWPVIFQGNSNIYECFKMLKVARVGKFRYFVDDDGAGTP